MLRLMLLCYDGGGVGEGGPERDKANMRDKCVQIVCHLSVFTSGVSR